MNEPLPNAPAPCRRHRMARCRVCGLHLELCVCAHLPRLFLPMELLLVQHGMETTRPTNTGRMALHMLTNSRALMYALGREPVDESLLRRPDRRYYLLFPREGAPVADRAILEPDDGRPVSLVVLDGTWRQAAHMARRIAPLREMPCLALPPGPPSAWDIRRPQRPEQLCTLEAVIRVVALLGRTAEARRMQECLVWINARMLYMKGLRKTPPSLEDALQEHALA